MTTGGDDGRPGGPRATARAVLVVSSRAAFGELLAAQLELRGGHRVVGRGPTAAGLEPGAPPEVILVDVADEAFAAEVGVACGRWPDAALVALCDPAVAARAVGRIGRPVVVPPDADVDRIVAAVDGAGSALVVLGADVLDQARGRLRGDDAPAAPVRLTPREREVLELLAGGQRPGAIAEALGISVHTCRRHVKSLLVKFDAHGQVELLVRAAAAGFAVGPRRQPTRS